MYDRFGHGTRPADTRGDVRSQPRKSYAGVLLCLCPAVAVAVAGEMRLDPVVAPVAQEIRLAIDAGREDYSGSVRIELRIEAATGSFAFHAEGQSLDRIELRDAAGPVGVSLERGADGRVEARTERPLVPGAGTLTIDFRHRFNTQGVGLYRAVLDGQGYLFTQFEAVDARKAFPCWDEPRFKIPYRLTLEVPEAHTAASNTPVERETVADGRRTLEFRRTPPLPSYLLAIAAGPLESVPIEGMSVPGRVYTVRGGSRLAGLTAEMSAPILAALERWFGGPYPYEKLDVVAAPEFWFGGMENPGLVVCTDSAVLLDPAAASVQQRRGLAGLLAHEFAHMWFGDLVTMEWWDDLWLNESFATYMGEKIVEELHPEFQAGLARRQGVQWLMAMDARPSTKAVRGAVDSAAAIWEDLGLAYGKGRTVLGMVEEWVGAEKFRSGVLDYLQEHAWENAVAADLFASLSKAAGTDVAGVLSSFLDQPGLPRIDLGVDAGGALTLRQSRFTNQGVEAPPQTWKVPLRLRYFDGETVKVLPVLLDGEAKTIDLGRRPEWIVPDDGANGYYRWSLPRQMLLDLAGDAPERLQPAERIAYLGNAAALLDAGAISGGDYLEILHRFAADPEPLVVSAAVSGLGKVSRAFVPDELRPAFAAYVRAALRPVLDRFGWQRVEGEQEMVSALRPQLLGWLGDEGGDREVRAYAGKLARAYMAEPRTVDPALAGTALGLAAIEGDRKLFDGYRSRFETAPTPVEREHYLDALGGFERAELKKEALSYALSGPLRPEEMLAIPQGMVRTERDGDEMLRWLLAHYGELTARMPAMEQAALPFSAGGCSERRLDEARRFFGDPAHQVDGTLANLEKVAQAVADCVRLRAREGPAVAAFLERFDRPVPSR
jgi:alanyl aminopeptidase